MSEDFPLPDAADEQPVAQAVTYEALLADPSTHKGLHPHLRRLAAENVGLAILDPPPDVNRAAAGNVMVAPQPAQPKQPNRNGGNKAPAAPAAGEKKALPSLGSMAGGLRRQSEAMFKDDPKNYGRSYFKPDKNTYLKLQSGEYGEKELVSFISAAKGMCDAFEDVARRRGEIADGGRYEAVLAALTDVPIEKMRSIYHSDKNSGDLRAMVEGMQTTDDLRMAFTFVTGMHGKQEVLELWDKDSTARRDPTFNKLVARDDSIFALTDTLEQKTPMWPEGALPGAETHNKRLWADRFLERVVGLPEGLRQELLFDSNARTSNNETGMVDTTRLRAMLLLTAHNTRVIGLDRVKQLHKEAGITSLDYYTTEPLQLMCDVLDGKPEVIKHLQDGDVTVVFANTKGDYNGGLRNSGSNYATKSGRTLFFEIDQPGDFYRYMSLLKRRGIKPSTVVMSAHGEAGVLPIAGANGGDGVEVVNKSGKRRWIDRLPGFRKRWERKQQEGQYDLSQEARGFARVVREYMQDSKGIDDNEGARGRRRIIMDACLAARPVEVYRPGLRRKFRRRSNEKNQESLVETIARAANNTHLDVFGNEETFQNELTDDGYSVRHFMNYKDDAGNSQRRELKATQVSIDRFGYVRSRRISQIPLHHIDDALLQQQLEQDLLAA